MAEAETSEAVRSSPENDEPNNATKAANVRRSSYVCVVARQYVDKNGKSISQSDYQAQKESDSMEFSVRMELQAQDFSADELEEFEKVRQMLYYDTEAQRYLASREKSRKSSGKDASTTDSSSDVDSDSEEEDSESEHEAMTGEKRKRTDESEASDTDSDATESSDEEDSDSDEEASDDGRRPGFDHSKGDKGERYKMSKKTYKSGQMSNKMEEAIKGKHHIRLWPTNSS